MPVFGIENSHFLSVFRSTFRVLLSCFSNTPLVSRCILVFYKRILLSRFSDSVVLSVVLFVVLFCSILLTCLLTRFAHTPSVSPYG